MERLDGVWVPSREVVERAEMTRLMRDVGASDYDELWRWSVEDLARFWRTVWNRYGIRADGDPSTVLCGGEMPGARWFPEVELSYPEHVFLDRDPGAVAVHCLAEDRPLESWTWARLQAETARVQAGLRGLGVGPGDRVVFQFDEQGQLILRPEIANSLSGLVGLLHHRAKDRSALKKLPGKPLILLVVLHGVCGVGMSWKPRAWARLARLCTTRC